MSIDISKIFNVSIDLDLENQIKREAIVIVNRKIKSTIQIIKDRVSEIFAELIKTSEVYEALTGANAGETDGSDLQAEFGLTEIMAETALTELIRIVSKSIIIEIEKDNQGPLVDVELSTVIDESSYEDKIRSGSKFHYISKNKNGTSTQINWMEYLIDAAFASVENYIDNVEKYGITFDGSLSTSRSGRAVMTRNKKNAEPNRSFPYTIPKKFVSFNGKNFVEDVIRSKSFRAKVNEIMNNTIEQILNGNE